MSELSGPAAGLDPGIHPLQRVRTCALLSPGAEEFSTIRDLLETSVPALSKPLSALASAGYLAQRRATRAGRRRVWMWLTNEGRSAFVHHVAALRSVASTIPPATDARG